MSNESQVSEAPVNFGANLGYVLDLYDIYLDDPSAVPEDLQVLFSTIKNGIMASKLAIAWSKILVSVILGHQY